MGKISKLPKIRVESPIAGRPKKLYNLEDAKEHLRFRPGSLISVDDHIINSYEALVQLAGLEEFKDREFLDVKILVRAGGG
jgi:hypothetical protein